MASHDPASTGDQTLDEMLRGGFPRNRSMLVTGGPGTGKSTLAMQFLQAGLDAGEECLYVSTEQTIDELRDSFRPYGFDLDHENLAFASVHARPGTTIEGGDERELTLQTLDDDGTILGEGFSAPFTGEYVRDYLGRYAPCDRVVFDSVSGLSALSPNPDVYRRAVLDLVREFTDEFGATTLFTAEARDDEMTGVLRFTTHGVINLQRKAVADDMHHFIEIQKCRGVDHDRRRAELQFCETGVRVGPARRSQPPAIKDHAHRPVGIEGLDALTGGGLVRGAGALLEHDGRANLSALYATLLGTAVEAGETTTLVPTIDLRQSRVENALAERGHDLDDLLAGDDLRVIDVIGAWDRDRENVYDPPTSTDAFTALLDDLADSATHPRYTIVSADAVAHALGPDGAREVRYAQETRLRPEDSLLYVLNAGVVGDEVAALHRDAAEQVLETRLQDDGLQYITLRKSPCGFVGTTSLVEYTTEPPYLRVQDPPQRRENPMADDP